VTAPIPRLFPLVPGAKLANDWHDAVVPSNIETGLDTLIDSSFCFRNYHSVLAVGFRVGRNVTLWRTSIATEAEGMIEIGDDCYIANASLVAARHITIGSRVFIAGGATLVDSDYHPIDPAARLADTVALSPVGDRSRRPPIETRPVVIGNDVWIGYNATILKGVRVGHGAIVSPGSLVLRDVEDGVTVAGNPAVPVVAGL